MHGEGTGEDICNKCTGDDNIFSIAQILDESFIDPMFFRIGWSELNWSRVIRINVNRFGIFVIPNYRFFSPNFFSLKIIFAISIFKDVVASKFFTFCFATPQQVPVGEI